MSEHYLDAFLVVSICILGIQWLVRAVVWHTAGLVLALDAILVSLA